MYVILIGILNIYSMRDTACIVLYGTKGANHIKHALALLPVHYNICPTSPCKRLTVAMQRHAVHVYIIIYKRKLVVTGCLMLCLDTLPVTVFSYSIMRPTRENRVCVMFTNREMHDVYNWHRSCKWVD